MSKVKFIEVELLTTTSKAGQDVINLDGSINPTAFNALPGGSGTPITTNVGGWAALSPDMQKMLTSMGQTQKMFDGASPGEKAKIMEAMGKIDNQGMNALDWTNAGVGAIGAGINIASYFDNKGMLEKQKEALQENILASREERAYRSKFRTQTASNFAAANNA